MTGKPRKVVARPLRISPGTIVTWVEKGYRRSGRVAHNLPGQNGKGPTLVITPTGGGRTVIAARYVTIQAESA